MTLWMTLALFLCDSANAAEWAPMRTRNTFSSATEVLHYFLTRDAARAYADVGMLDAERTAFTEWTEAPHAESHYIAKSYRIATARPREETVNGHRETRLVVEYKLVGLRDAGGGMFPLPETTHRVEYRLRKRDRWRIVAPEAELVIPVVVEAAE